MGAPKTQYTSTLNSKFKFYSLRHRPRGAPQTQDASTLNLNFKFLELKA